MNDNWRKIIAIGAVAVLAYLAWNWWENRQSNGSAASSTLGDDAYLTAGGSGSDSGLNYYQGSTTVTLPSNEQTTSQNPVAPKSATKKPAPKPKPKKLPALGGGPHKPVVTPAKKKTTAKAGARK